MSIRIVRCTIELVDATDPRFDTPFAPLRSEMRSTSDNN
jgi:hypothetical protein